MKRSGLFTIIYVLLLVCSTVSAQDEVSPPERVEVTAADGLTLVGDYWTAGDEIGAPAVLLMHMLGSNRDSWEPLVTPLRDAGFHVLAVDLRGHGETGGSQDWTKAEADVQTWLDWVKEQMGVTSVTIVGASIGSNLALIGCANDPDCLTAGALSPGLDYRGVQPEQAVVEGLAERSALLVAAQGDQESIDAVRQMADGAAGEIGVRIYTGRAHGTNLFQDKGTRVSDLIVAWLVEQTTTH